MSNETGRGNASVPVHYHQFHINDEDEPTGPDLEPGHNGLFRLTDGLTIIDTPGLHTGDVEVTVTLHKTEPAPDNGHWQEIVEVSAHSASGDLMIRGMTDDLDVQLPVLSFHRPGDYRLRIHARSRDTAIGLPPDQIAKWYLIQAWPVPSDEARVPRQTDGLPSPVCAPPSSPRPHRTSA
jgi:hypothetical protein